MRSGNIIINGLYNFTANDWDKSIACLTDAFSEDPCLKYLLESDLYDFEKAKYIHQYTLKYGTLFGHIFTTGNNVEGVSIWLPPERQNVSSFMTAWMFIRAGGLKLNKLVNPTTVNMIKKYSDFSGELHHRSISKPHWYLMSIGVEKQYQGKGFAKKLIIPMLNFFDQHNQSCYLETHNPNNVEIYRKYGFKVTETGILPGSDKIHWSMLREPETKI